MVFEAFIFSFQLFIAVFFLSTTTAAQVPFFHSSSAVYTISILSLFQFSLSPSITHPFVSLLFPPHKSSRTLILIFMNLSHNPLRFPSLVLPNPYQLLICSTGSSILCYILHQYLSHSNIHLNNGGTRRFR